MRGNRPFFFLLSGLLMSCAATSSSIEQENIVVNDVARSDKLFVETTVKQALAHDDLVISKWTTLRNGGERVFQINGLDLEGRDYAFTFSANYILSDPGAASTELQHMYDLLVQFPEMTSVDLWNAHYDSTQIIRTIQVADTYMNIEVDSSWKYAIDDVRGLISPDCPDFYIPTAGLSIEELLQDVPAFASAKYEVKSLFGINVDVFSIEGSRWSMLKGKDSTILYDQDTNEFRLAGYWGDSEIVNVDLDQRRMIVLDNDDEWEIRFIDTKDNHTCSAYQAVQY